LEEEEEEREFNHGSCEARRVRRLARTMPREIMTLQLGGYSNFVGSHFWNIQEECMSYADDDDARETAEVRADILWRQTSETVVPRLMTLDLKSERGALRRRGYLYSDEEEAAAAPEGVSEYAVAPGAWGGPVASFYSDPVSVHPFVQHLLDTDAEAYEDDEEEADDDDERDEDAPRGHRQHGFSEDDESGGGGRKGAGEEGGTGDGEAKDPDFVIEDGTVRFWSDYLKVSFHPRTCHDLTQGFGTDYMSYCAGIDWGADDSLREEWEENLHWWVEECDTLQGFHILADTDTAFGAIATSLCMEIRDDFPRKPLVIAGSAPARPGRDVPQTRMHASAEAISFGSLLPSGNIYTPLHGPAGDETCHVPAGMQTLPAHPSYYRTSALAAAALDTATLPWRRRRAPGGQAELLSRTAGLFHGRPAAGLQTYMPVPAISAADLVAAREAAKAAGKEDAGVGGIGLEAWLGARGAPLRLSPHAAPKRKSASSVMGVGMGREWTRSEHARWDVARDAGTGDHNIYAQSVVLRGLPDDAEYQVLDSTIKREQVSGGKYRRPPSSWTWCHLYQTPPGTRPLAHPDRP